MKTVIYSISEIEAAGAVLRAGGLIAFPTETVYGLGGNALDADASRRIFAAKGRPADNPLIAHIADIAMLDTLCHDIPEAARRLALATMLPTVDSTVMVIPLRAWLSSGMALI